MALIETTVCAEASEFLEPVTYSHKAESRRLRKQKKASQGGQGSFRPLIAKNERQADMLAYLDEGEDLFAVGGAGTGKTYLAARKAARALIQGKVERIIVARVTVSKAKHALGFLPGKLEQKLAPWLVPVFDGLKAEISGQTLDQWKTEGKLEMLSFEHMRGRTLDNAFVILDEAQNADLGDLKLFLTRIGEGSQVVVTGDLDQIDIPNSGLNEVLDLVERYGIPMQIVRFTSDDVVRSALARSFVQAFEASQHVSNKITIHVTDSEVGLGNVSFLRAGSRGLS